MHFVKQLHPEQMIRLFIGDEIFVVIPPFNEPPISQEANLILNDVMRRFDDAILDSFGNSTRSNREDDSFTTKKVAHAIHRYSRVAYEFAVRVRHYPERTTLEIPYNNLLKESYSRYWSDGHGITIELCGYPKDIKVLLPFRCLSFVEIYLLTKQDNVLNEHIKFPDVRSPAGLIPHLSNFVTLFDGCRSSIIELSSKFYQAESKSKSRVIANLKDKLVNHQTMIHPVQAIVQPIESTLQEEITHDRLVEFCQRVDESFHEAFRYYYRNFTALHESIIPFSEIDRLSSEIEMMFPIMFQCMKMTVDPGRIRMTSRIHLANDMNDGNNPNDYEMLANVQNHAHKKRFIIFHHFLGLLRSRSQKALRYWSILIPLTTWGKGGIQSVKNNTATGTSCTLKTGFNILNKI
jgi:hypothetical protein